jgi:hypothetical protein
VLGHFRQYLVQDLDSNVRFVARHSLAGHVNRRTDCARFHVPGPQNIREQFRVLALPGRSKGEKTSRVPRRVQ